LPKVFGKPVRVTQRRESRLAERAGGNMIVRKGTVDEAKYGTVSGIGEDINLLHENNDRNRND
jgi:hypothetical protein